MIKQENLDRFLDAFLDNRGGAQADDPDFYESEKQEKRTADDNRGVSQTAGWDFYESEEQTAQVGDRFRCGAQAADRDFYGSAGKSGQWNDSTRNSAQTADWDFYGSEEQTAQADDKLRYDGALREQRADFRERQQTGSIPANRRKLPKRTVLALFLLAVAVPVTIWIGLRFFNDRKYLMIALVIAVYSMIPFVLVFEGRKPQPRELLTIAVLVAIAVAGRAVFYMLPNFKPTAAVTIIAAIAFGAESGFMVGAVSMLASNLLFGQGPWTPWQMCAMGLIGFVAGIAFQKGWLKAKKLPLCVFGFLATLLIYGGIMNFASLTMYSYAITPRNLLFIYMSGLPMDLVHASSTVIFLWLAAKPMLEKLERIKVKYGMIPHSGGL